MGKGKKSEQEGLSTKNWVPIKNIKRGIVELKNGTYVKILEVLPVNFNLKSMSDRRFLIINYRAFLKACRFPMQISIQCRKADVDPHIKRIQSLVKMEKNENVKHMAKGYMRLVRSLSMGTRSAISRRFFLVIPFVMPIGIRTCSFVDIEKQLTEKIALIRDYLNKCGNDVIDLRDSSQVADLLYSYLNKKSYEVQKFGNKFMNLSGLFLNSQLEEEGDEEE